MGNALDNANNEGDFLALVSELQGHVWELMCCPNANYVIQKVICLAKPKDIQFIINEIVAKGTDAIRKAARQKFACRILQRLLEHCMPSQVDPLSSAILGDLISLSRHPFGNFVVQDILEYGTVEEQSLIFAQLEKHASTLGVDTYGCSVIGKAMTCGESEQQRSLAEKIVADSCLLNVMLQTRHNRCVAKHVMQKLGICIK